MPSSQTRSSARWIVLSVAVLVAGGVWVLTSVLRGADVRAAHVESAAPGEARESAEASLDAAETTRSAERARVAGEAVAAASTANAEPSVDGPKLGLRALRAGSLEPVPGVEFTWAVAPEDAVDSTRFWTWFTNGELEARIADGAKQVTGDATGRAEIPKPKSQAVVIAAAPGWWGLTLVSEDPDPVIEILVAPDRELAVQVVDGAGRPVADVPIALRAVYWGNPQDRLRARTAGEDGIARLKHVGSVLGQGGAQEWTVALAIAAVKPISVPIELAKLPSEPVRLVLPPTGSCEVRLLDESGELAHEPFDVTLNASLPNVTDERAKRRPDQQGANAIDVRDGVAVFPFVELGVEVNAVARRPNNWAMHTARGPGPKRIGEKAELVLNLGRDVTTLRGRAVDLAGAPLVRRDLAFKLRVVGDGESVQQIGSARTDETGAFRLDIGARNSVEQSYTLIVEADDTHTHKACSGTRPLPTPLPKGVIEVGDVSLDELPVVLAGNVVDQNGAPVASAMVSAQTHIPNDDWDGFDGDNYWWANVRTDEQGHFELHGKPFGDEFRISASHDDQRSPPSVVRRGDGEIVLRVGPTGSILGRVLRDESNGGEALSLNARLAEEGAQDDEAQSNVAADGAFALRHLLPGTYVVALQDQTRWNELKTIPDVVVRAGEITRDPRLDPLDLRGSHFVVHLTIVDEHGDPVPRGWFVREFTNAEGEQDQEYGPIANGKATVSHDGSGANVRLRVEGFCSLRVENLLTDRTVTLRRAPTVRLAVRPVPKLEPGVQLYASIAREGSDDDDGAWFQIGANGEAEERLPTIGTVVVTFIVNVGGDDNGEWQSIAGVEAKLDVQDVPGVQLFEVALDETKLAEAIAAARATPAQQDE